VRKLAKEQNYDKIKTLVPLATYQFLLSKEGKALFNHE
jgi:citrate lyase synthetase